MKAFTRKFPAFIFILIGSLMLLGASVSAEQKNFGAFFVVGDDLTGVSYSAGTLTIRSNAPITIDTNGTSSTTDRIFVADGVNADITLAGVDINVSTLNKAAAFGIADNSAGNVTITLADSTDNILKSGGKCAGLQKSGTVGSLTIKGGTLGTGKLTAIGGSAGAGIGGGQGRAGSNITISGGTVTATGGADGAGIGGGENCVGSNITISGGTVTATGGSNGAGIGGGFYGAGRNITISGGTVTATGGSNGAGIGDGYNGAGSNIIISGGSVKAAAMANAIGGGKSREAVTPTSDGITPVYRTTLDTGSSFTTASVALNSGTAKTYSSHPNGDTKLYFYLPTGEVSTANLNAETIYTCNVRDKNSNQFGVSLGGFIISGGSQDVDFEYLDEELRVKRSTNLTISNVDPSQPVHTPIKVAPYIDANLTLNNVNIDTTGQYKAAIEATRGTLNLTIANDSNNVLKAGDNSAAINIPEAGILEVDTLDRTSSLVNFGRLYAKGGNGGAGIGGGVERVAGKIIINSGILMAEGGDNAPGIGAGQYGTVNGDVVLNGGNVIAIGGSNGPAIGLGESPTSGSKIIIRNPSLRVVAGTGATSFGYHVGGSETKPENPDGDPVYAVALNLPETTAAARTLLVNGGPVTIPMIASSKVINLWRPEGFTKVTAEDGTEYIAYVKANATNTFVRDDRPLVVTGGAEGTDYTYENGVVLVKTGTVLTIKNRVNNTATTNCVEIEKDKNANIILAGVNIETQNDTSPLKIADFSTGTVTITLADGTENVLKSEGFCAGIEKNGPDGNLIIQSGPLGTGKLTATAANVGAGIGGGGIRIDINSVACNITINSGTVTAIGGTGAAGIGSGISGTCSNIKINGGSVLAVATNGAAIGSSQNAVIPTDSSGNNVYLTTLDIGSSFTTTSVSLNGGASKTYASHPNNDTKLYFYLPAGSSTATAAGKAYTANVNTSNNSVFKLTSSAVFTDKTESFTGLPIKNELAVLPDGIESVSYTYSGINGTSYSATANAPSAIGEYEVTAVFTMKSGYHQLAAMKAKLTIIDATITGVTATGYEGTYDEKPHSITVSAPSGTSVTYGTDGTSYSATNPSYTNIGEYTVYYKVSKTGSRDLTGSAKVVIKEKEKASIPFVFNSAIDGFKLGRDGLKTHITYKMESGDSFEVNMRRDITIVPRSVIETMMGKDVTITFTSGKYSKTINGKDITKPYTLDISK